MDIAHLLGPQRAVNTVRFSNAHASTFIEAPICFGFYVCAPGDDRRRTTRFVILETDLHGLAKTDQMSSILWISFKREGYPIAINCAGTLCSSRGLTLQRGEVEVHRGLRPSMAPLFRERGQGKAERRGGSGVVLAAGWKERTG